MKKIKNLVYRSTRPQDRNRKIKSAVDDDTVDAIRQAIIELHKAGKIKGFFFGFNLNGKVFCFECSLENALQRIKVTAKGEIILYTPYSREQAREMVEREEVDYLCTLEELQAVKKGKNNGEKLEYILARKTHGKFDHTKGWLEGGGELQGRECKFSNEDNDTASKFHAIITLKKLATLGYQF